MKINTLFATPSTDEAFNLHAIAENGEIISREITKDQYLLIASKQADSFNPAVDYQFTMQDLRDILGANADLTDVDRALAINQLVEQEDRIYIEDSRLYVSGVKFAIPQVIADQMVAAFESDDRTYLEILLKFWGHLAKHSDAITREDLYGFFKRMGRLILADNGYVVAFRGSRMVEPRNLEMYDGIIAAHALAKKHKKSPKNLGFDKSTGRYCDLSKDGAYNNAETLESLFERVDDFLGRYTDCYTGKMDLRFGQITAVPRSEVVEDRTVTCDRGLHITGFPQLNKQYYRHSSTMVYHAVAVNPLHVLAVPTDYDLNKGRCRQYMIIDELATDENGPIEPSWYNDLYFTLSDEQTAILKKQYLNEVTSLIAGADQNETVVHELAFLSLDTSNMKDGRLRNLFDMLLTNNELLDKMYLNRRESTLNMDISLDDDYDEDYDDDEDDDCDW